MVTSRRCSQNAYIYDEANVHDERDLDADYDRGGKHGYHDEWGFLFIYLLLSHIVTFSLPCINIISSSITLLTLKVTTKQCNMLHNSLSLIRFWRVFLFFFVIVNNTLIDVTLLLHLWSCHINHNISATRMQLYLTDTLIWCGLGNLIGSYR